KSDSSATDPGDGSAHPAHRLRAPPPVGSTVFARRGLIDHLENLGEALTARGGIGPRHASDQSIEPRRLSRRKPGRAPLRPQKLIDGCPGERKETRASVVDARAKLVEIGTRIGRGAFELLGRGERKRARAAWLARAPRAHVKNLRRPVAREEDVRRVDVAVNGAVSLDEMKRVGEPAKERDDLGDRERPLRAYPRGEAPARQVLHAV